MSDRDTNLKEKLRQALSSTFKVISDDLKINKKSNNNKSSNKFDFFENASTSISESIPKVCFNETFISG